MTPPVHFRTPRRSRGMRRLLAVSVLAAAPFFVGCASMQSEYATSERSQSATTFAATPAQRYLALDDEIDSDSLSEEQAVLVMSRVYRYQSDILLALSADDTDEAEGLFDLAMADLARLRDHEDILGEVDRPRYRELYRSVITEYEHYYGVAPDDLQTQRGGVFALRAEMFAALNDDSATLDGMTLPDLRPAETEFPMTRHRLVDQSIAYLLKSPDKHLYRWIERSHTYFPMIEQILEEEGVPDELKYLAMIESGLRPNVNSWAQAGGLWQFIRPTGRAYGLEVNEWVDERMDPEKATRAAARHLRDLHTMFGGDWQLALAGYNCSPARIKRALRRAESRLGRTPTFWDIYDDIPRETRNYVPQFIATALLVSNPSALDLTSLTPGPRYTYERVAVKGPLPLDRAAELAGVDEQVVRALNPELRRAIVPRTNGHYALRLPAGTAATLVAALGGSEQSGPETEHTVETGDSLSKLARRYGTTVEAIQSRNNLASKEIVLGEALIIPAPYSEATGGVALANGQIEYVQYAARQSRPIQMGDGSQITPTFAANRSTSSSPTRSSSSASSSTRSTPTRTVSAETRSRTVYRVKRGDNLSKIAQRYGVTVGQIRNWNDLSGSTIRSGQRLTLYTDGSAPAAASASSAPVRSASYRVQRGDNLSEIAQRHGTTVANLREWNNLSGSTIRSGQNLKVQAPASASTHRVVRGDNLTAIAQRYGVTVQQLRAWNDLSGSTIRPGQRLRVSG